MNPLSRRRAARRRLIADWAARVTRVAAGDPDVADPDYGAEEPPGDTPARRLPFELLDPPAAIAVAQPSPNGNGHAVDQPAAQALPSAEPMEPATAADVPPPIPVAPELLQAARHAMEQRDLVHAEHLYRQLLETTPGDLRARTDLALVLDAEGEHQAALEELDRCRAQDGGNLEVWVNRSAVLGAMGQYREAERDLRSVLDREPTNAAAHFQLGLVASRRGRWREAVPRFAQAIALEPNLAGAHFYLGEALNHVDDLPGALQAYQRAVELSPTNPKAWYGMGIVLDRMNRPDDAAQLYRRSRELQGK